jgi:hypothetical protein
LGDYTEQAYDRPLAITNLEPSLGRRYGWYVRRALSRRKLRITAVLAPIAAAIALSACGGGSDQAASEPSGNFPVGVPVATFPKVQRLAQHTHLVIAVRNTGNKTIPNVAITICNVTCAYPAPKGQGTDAGAFAADISQTGVANPSRPTWVVDTPPAPPGAPAALPDGQQGAPGGAVTAYSNTWALGALAPGHTARFNWAVTAVSPGKHVVAWEVAAGLNGKAKAVLTGGGRPHGTFTVLIRRAPEQTFVTDSGKIKTQKPQK